MKTEYSCRKAKSEKYSIKVFILIIILSLILRFVFLTEHTADKYVDAFGALGSGLSHETEFTEAVKDAYTYAFLEEEEEYYYVAGIENERDFKH